MASPSIEALQSWVDQDLVLFHGTSRVSAERILNSGVMPIYFRLETDFGLGFYTTTVRTQAERWARKIAKRRRSRDPDPALIEFVISRKSVAELETLSFVNGSSKADDLWAFIHHCRAGHNHKRSCDGASPAPFYDAVFGPVAANWEKNRAFLDSDQISFHTDVALSLLNAAGRRRMILL